VKPHKLVLLLAVVDMFEDGLLRDNRIYFDRELRERFSFYFKAVKQPGDSCRPHIPFFHLRSSGWWHLKPRIGREWSYERMKTCSSIGDLEDNVEYAFVDDQVYSILVDTEARRQIRDEIALALGHPELAYVHYSTQNDQEGSDGEQWPRRRNR
jgi:predicted restriction endonuclease